MPPTPRRLQIRFFALLREQAGCTALEVESDAPDAAALYAELQGRLPGLTFPVALLRVARNDRYAGLADPLAAGDRIVFIPPVAGG
jgi:molybdopterin converting factor small subunit